MDLTTFAKASVSGVPLVLVIMGLVAWFKGFRKKDGNRLISGNGLQVISMAIGLALGGGYVITQTRPPSGDWWVVFGYWFAVVVYGLMEGIVASGLYDTARGLVEKTFGELFQGLVASLAGKK